MQDRCHASTRRHAGEVAVLFLQLGLVAFGGPAAHIGVMRRATVQRRGWLSDAEFLDLLGASHVIPGPTSTELAILLGRWRAGAPGLLLGGLCFLMPACLLVLGLAWAYVRWGTTPGASALLYGVKPVIIAVVAQALWELAPTAARSRTLAAIGLAAATLSLWGVAPLPLLLVGGLAGLLSGRSWLPGKYWSAAVIAVPVAAGHSLWSLALVFLKVGALLYGSGYVLLAFLRSDFVEQLRWITDKQLVDAVAVGQLTPGPLFSTATFIGYLTDGWAGAAVATGAIFLPSFLFVAVIYPLIPRLRSSARAGSMLDGVNVAALGLMAAVTLQLAQTAVIDLTTGLLALATLLVLLRWQVNTAWLVLAGGLLGLLSGAVR